MASGCILGECPYCKELIWEDEIFIYSRNERVAHLACDYKHEEKDKRIMQLRAKLRAAEIRIKELEAEKCL